jgi:undecaprenyl phosphate N,N'-diacetylbacillosamine 1-phosphate transferase
MSQLIDYKNIKRGLDIFFSILLFPISIFLILLVGLLIKLEDNGPVFYIGIRLGKNQIPFKMIKFRTMYVNAPDIRLNDGSTFSSKSDTRVTKIGKFLRETSIDEIPQIYNVLIGDMSLIGPRPDVINKEKLSDDFIKVLSVKPGITGYNQAYYRNESTRIEKMNHDLYYVNNFSFRLDLKIIGQTIRIILKRKGIYKAEN